MAIQPLVTTIIPTYNRAGLVCGAVDSVLAQTYPNLEIIVVDDGSTDDTLDRLRAYGRAIRVISQENAGPSAARNRGIAAANGEVVAFLDSDDAWDASKLERQVRALERGGPAVPCCLCNATIHRADGSASVTTFEYAGLRPAVEEGIWENVTEVLSTRFVMFTQMVAIRRSVLERLGGFDERLRLMEDYDLALRLSLEGPWAYIAEPLVSYRQDSPGSLASAAQRDAMWLIESSVEARRKLYDEVRRHEHHRHLRQASARALNAYERERLGIRLSNRRSWPASAAGRLVLLANRVHRALYRRSPWYPEMKVRAITASA